jgi:hypothetical protein
MFQGHRCFHVEKRGFREFKEWSKGLFRFRQHCRRVDLILETSKIFCRPSAHMKRIGTVFFSFYVTSKNIYRVGLFFWASALLCGDECLKI